jgi:outer membrane protein assembly factor BamB
MNSISTKMTRLACLGVMVLCFLFVCTGCSKDVGEWPHWRGPDRNGISPETDWNPEALAGGPKVLWHVDAGIGYSNVAIGAGRLYTMGMLRGTECVLCLEANTGEEIWRHPTEGRSQSQTTPAIQGKHVYAVSHKGTVLCLKAKNGELVWSRQLVEEFDAPKPQYGYGTSPVIREDLVVINAKHTGIALDKRTGELLWQGKTLDLPACNEYSTPVFYEQDGKTRMLLFSFPGLFALDPDTGEQLWFYEWMKLGSPNVADPVLFDHRVFISSSESDSRGAVLDIGGPEPQLVWESPEMANHLSTCIYLDGYLYGAHGDYFRDVKRCTLRCLDAESGQLMWEEKTGGAALTAADGKLIVLTFKGTLYIAEASSAAFKIISSCEVPSRTKGGAWWTPPVLCNGKIYCRSHIGDLVCIDVST